MSDKNECERDKTQSSRREFAKKAAFTVPILSMLGSVEMKAGMSLGMHGEPLREERGKAPEAKKAVGFQRRSASREAGLDKRRNREADEE